MPPASSTTRSILRVSSSRIRASNVTAFPQSAPVCSRSLHRVSPAPRPLSPWQATCSAGPSRSARTFTTSHSSRAALAQHPPGQHSVLASFPSPASLHSTEEDADEPDVDYIPPEEARLEITDRAAEQLRSITQRENDPNAALRISVESGGCHGYQYKMALAKSREADDYVFSHPTVQPSNIVVDAVSMALLKGSTIDFTTELIGSSFQVVDNPQAKGSSCGCGVSWELKI